MVGTPGATRLGNTQLVDYGISQENSDIRAHVSIMAQAVYVYPTKSGLAAIASDHHQLAPAFTGSIKTAEGYLVKPGEIKHCRRVPIPDHIMATVAFSQTDSVSVKGKKAVRVVHWLLRSGNFPLWTEPSIVEDVDMQVEGLDIIVRMKTRIQVKCDWRAGEGEGCTGNLFLQVRECNPYGQV